MPGTPIAQGQVPGANLIPASPPQVLSLGNRAPALVPHAVAGNGVPDKLASAVPAYEPRLAGAASACPKHPQCRKLRRNPAANAVPFYFLGEQHGHPSPGGRDAGSVPAPQRP